MNSKEREIKFRAWDLEVKVMSGEFSLFGEFTLMGAVHDWQMEIRNIDTVFENGDGPNLLEKLGELKIMQYTGLKDKNGKEIYEGDILRCYDSIGEVLHWVIFQDGRFVIEYIGYGKNRSGFNQSWVDEFKNQVIGNIYENPSLTLNPKGI